ncbi:MAG TPA: BACON domain-containing carbohydrate-binding protein [Blastocatellia bacterium]|nr:BACON domain-containing carbohydrate-binding protein [Blastocatellia bacterium]
MTSPANLFSLNEPASRRRPSRLVIAAGVLLLAAASLGAIELTRKVAASAHSSGTARKATGLRQRVTVRARQVGSARYNVSDGRDLEASFEGAAAAQEAIEQNRADPLSLVAGDFDEDGVADLVSGYRVGDAGLLALYRGNVQSIFPNSPEAKTRKSLSEATDSPFLAAAGLFDAPASPEFLAAGDFNNDGHLDVVAATRGSDGIYLLPGDGRGGFGIAERIQLPGGATALAAGEINRADGLADLAIATAGAAGPRLLIFEDPRGAFNSAPEVFTLPAEASGIALGRIDGDPLGDVVVAAGRDLVLLRGRDRGLSVGADLSRAARQRIERRAFKFGIRSIAVGDFAGEGDSQVAILADDGSIQLLSAGTRSRRGKRSSPGLKTWGVDRASLGPWPDAKRLISSRFSNFPGDSLMVAGSANNELHIAAGIGATRTAGTNGAPSAVEERATASYEVEGGAVAVIGMRLNGDALGDLVMLRKGNIAPGVVIPLVAMTFTVTTINDSGPGSLRQAILDSNSNAGADSIGFAIGTGPQTIILSGDLPQITDPVTIDGTTQPGFAGTPIVTLPGSGTVSGIPLKISAGATTVRGLVINNSSQVGIQLIQAGGNIVEGNYLGTDAAGTAVVPNDVGVQIVDTPNNTIGGTTASARNVISASAQDGVRINGTGAMGNMVEGNYIGLTAAGDAALPNQRHGVFVNAMSNTIGGTAAGAGNVISGNGNGFPGTGNGVHIFGNAPSAANMVQGNLIGTSFDGSTALPNTADGIQILDSPGNTIGGTAPGAGNTISGNGASGLFITGLGSTGNMVQGNTIGSTGLANARKGVLILDASDNAIGGTAMGAANAISFNTESGVAVVASAGLALRNTVRGNSIFTNGMLGIDLADDGVTANDTGDGDGGPNLRQNFPVLGTPVGGPNTVVPGTLNSIPSTMYTIDFYSNSLCDDSGFGEGATFLGSTTATTDGSGVAIFSATLPVATIGGEILTATATDPNGNTSEFSACVIVCVFSISPMSQSFTEAGGSDTVIVTTEEGCLWGAVSNDAFITITSPGSGSGSSVVEYSVAANPSSLPRVGTMTIAGQTFTVNQAGAPCVFSIMPTSQSFLAAGGTGSVAVTSPIGCAWTAVSNDAFITVTSGASGSGNGTVNYSVAVKSDVGSRMGTITIAGETFTVTQAGIDCSTLSIMPMAQSFPVGGGTGMVSVTALAGCAWTAVSNDAFITVTSGSSGMGNGTVNYSVAANPNPGTRMGTITIGGQTFTVTQAGTISCVFGIAPTEDAFPATGGTGVVNVSAPMGCNWTAVSNAAFITITSGASGTGNGSVVYSVAAKSSAGIRTGTMTIAGLTFTVNQAGTSCITSISPTDRSFTSSGGAATVSVTAPTGCSSTATSLNAFITIVSGVSGTGSRSVKYSVAANSLAGPRVGFIIVGSNVHKVTQTGVMCTFGILPLSQGFPAAGGTGSVNVTTTAGCAWTAVSNDAFIMVTSGGAGAGSGTVNYSVAANLSATPRTGTITIAGILFTVNQAAAAGSCTFSIIPMSLSLRVDRRYRAGAVTPVTASQNKRDTYRGSASSLPAQFSLGFLRLPRRLPRRLRAERIQAVPAVQS